MANTHPKNPLLRLVGVVTDLPEARVEEFVLNQNGALVSSLAAEDKKIRVIRRTRGRNNLINNVILEVSPAPWQRLQGRRLRIGYQVVEAYDQTQIMQCYNCMGFGHRARDCEKDPKCGHCAGAHDTRKCSEKTSPASCIN